MTLAKIMRCMTVGFVLAILAIGLLPFLLANVYPIHFSDGDNLTSDNKSFPLV
ncbi:hypothetical protein [Cohnella yongneupensis]|uniref:DUF1648 domain-containing protein n=1 Tax=Cohnella yongneupensis TaxID=425006 RepID=A0ABW0QYB2_9BACL